jgi:oxygen-independent coproporphyrinogen-3 oxidase
MSGNVASRGKIGWYVHLPFCSTKCGYCDFYSLPTIGDLIQPLIGSLQEEMRLRDPGRSVQTIFIGGGTPTVMPADALQVLLADIRSRTGAVDEFTVEANPSSADELKLSLLRAGGVNRVSFGAQSFHADELAILDRIHDPSNIPTSVALARAAGFDNVNLDLIYGIPGQSLTRWRDSLRRAIDLQTDHLSCYALMYEPNTAMTKLREQGKVTPCDEELEADMFEMTIDELSAAGYEHYEISNFARPGRRCMANMIYWQNREYLGIGPSAVSYLDGVRTKNIADVRKYVEIIRTNPESAFIERERLDSMERWCETAVQMLRLTDGIDVALFHELTGTSPTELFANQIARLSSIGLLIADKKHIRLTRRGLLVANRVMQEFLPDSPPTAATPAPAASAGTSPGTIPLTIHDHRAPAVS